MTTLPKVLIVDDEPDICELLEITLSRMGIDPRSVGDLEAAKSLLESDSFSLCLTDMRLPDGNGIDFVRHVQHASPDVPIAVITAHGNMESAIEALKAGAFDFLSKPVQLNTLRELVSTALKVKPTGGQEQRDLVGDSSIMEETRAKVRKLAQSQAPIYVSGESGTGKELVARMIHEQGPRAEAPFVPVNCGAIPDELMESEFFGHLRGSFTGAHAEKAGLFQSAHGGTLFLDEVAELPLQMQVKLLRAIQEKSVRPIGATRELPIDVRILSATHKNLEALVDEGKFRQDLFYRINVIEIKVPALRERVEDIPELSRHILDKLCNEAGRPEVRLSDDALQRLRRYRFPGNVRELENILERSLTLCESPEIKVEDLGLEPLESDVGSPTQETSAINGEGDAITALPTDDAAPLDQALEDMERDRIVRALEANRWNKTATAKALGISFRALRYRLKKLGVD
jgi:two-component system response regulator PilR (NtrC family)